MCGAITSITQRGRVFKNVFNISPRSARYVFQKMPWAPGGPAENSPLFCHSFVEDEQKKAG